LISPKHVPFEEPELSSPEPESDFNIAEYLGMVRRHWKLVAAACVLALAAASIHYAITPKEYMATTRISIERRSLTSLSSGAQNPWFENYWNLEYYPTQYELLKSRGLAERVARNLDLASDPAFNPGAAGRGAAASSAEEDEAMLGALAERLRGGLSVGPVRGTQLVDLSYRDSSPEFAARAANAFVEAYIDMGVEARYATAGKASSFLTTQIDSLKQEIEDKESQLQAFSRRTDIITLEPESNVTQQRLESLNTNYIDARKRRIEREAKYNEVLSSPPETVADSLSGGLVSELRSDQLRLEREYETKLKKLKPDHPDMAELKAQIDKGQQHIDSIIREKVETAKKSALAEYHTAQREEEKLAAELEMGKGAVIDQNSAAFEYTNLKLEIQTRRELLDQLLRQQSETEVTVRLQDTRESNVQIVDKALMPGGPFRPSLRQDLSYGLLLGLLFGIGCAFLIEFLDRTIKTPEEIERRLGLAPLAVIQDIADSGKDYGSSGYGYGYGAEPAIAVAATDGAKVRAARAAPASWLEKKKGVPNPQAQIELVPHERPRTLISEAYRSLRTALLLSSARELKLVAVTSAVAGEGKTATASNLAVVLAQLGRPVLIVDCDLRKPRLHQVFRVSNRVGLVNHLTATADPETVFLPTEVPNLWVTPSGPIPPNPSELLASDRMREWLKTVRSRFEYVIIDTPPALAVTDSTIIGVLADGVVLTLRSGKVTREEARLCRDRLRLADVRVLGAVLNRYRSVQAGFGKRYRAYEAYVADEETAAKAGSAA
jgi:succinoglycan biosynthesis transport protein ExoP